MQVYQAIGRAIAAEGVEVVFGLLGGGIDTFIAELEGCGVRFVPVRHEQAAVAMADGYSRATGRIGVAAVTYGPGISNAGAMLTAARLARSRVLLISADTGPGARLNPMNIDQPSLILATAGAIQPIGSAATAAEDVALAFRHLRLGRGPIVLNMPENVSRQAVAEDWTYDPCALSIVPQQLRYPDPAEIDRVARLIDESDRPIVLAGRGAVAAQARDALLALADRTGAILASSLPVKRWFDGDPFNAGLSGAFASDDARDLLNEADLVLAFGASLNRYTTGHGSLYRRARIVQIDTNPAQVGDVTPVADAILGDARVVAEQLAARVTPRDGWRSAALADRISRLDEWQGIDFSEPAGLANPHVIIRILEESLPRERVVVIDIGQFMGVPAAHLSVAHPDDAVYPWQLGSMGAATGVAIGAAAGRPDRLTVLVQGDGGFFAGLPDLETAVRCDLPILAVIMDDGGFGAERRLFRSRGQDVDLAGYANPDIAAVARSLGYESYTVRSGDDLRAALDQARPRDRATLFHVVVDPDARFDEMARASSFGPR